MKERLLILGAWAIAFLDWCFRPSDRARERTLKREKAQRLKEAQGAIGGRRA